MLAPDFDWTAAPLSGLQLIEASAGTGKTWTLTRLYLRLLLETELQPEHILVVTFTKAATTELKERIRHCLLEVWKILNGEKPTESAFAQTLYQRYGEDPYLLRKLHAAIRYFDRAAVYTIHGFCQRILTDHAFSMGATFCWRLNPDDSLLIKRLIEDFWHQHITTTTGLWPRFLYTQCITPKTWLIEIQQLLGKINYSQVLVPTLADTVMLEENYHKAYMRVRTLWLNEAEQITACVLTCKLGYRSTSFDKLTQMLSPDTAHFSWEQTKAGELGIQRFSTAALAKAAQEKNKPVPYHAFFEAIDDLLNAYRRLWEAFGAKQATTLVALLQHCEKELPWVKQRQQEVAYNDLLIQVDQALARDHQGKLARLLHNRFAAALIDEFQDTDPVQYRIFSRIYQGTPCPVYLIGDPKQAIYSFRGANIHTYLTAQADTVAQWTLRINYRSSPAVLDSLHHLFTRQAAAFWLPQIHYVKVTSSNQSLPVLQDPDSTAALQCWRLTADDEQTRLTKDRATTQVIAATGAEIQRLLQRVTLNQKPITAGEIAILVPCHRYAAQILAHLVSIGIPAVRQGMDNVLVSSDAWEWLRVLSAFLEPQREALRKSALVTIYMGIDAASLLRLSEDEARWEAIALQFAHYHELWQRYGITRAFRAWLSDWSVASRLMRLPDGERRLTNLLHLIDILQQKSQTFPQLALLVDWFSREMVMPSMDEEIAQLRLESDAARVKIITIHAAKGLEFPIVFNPFLWHAAARENTQRTVVFHDETGQSYLDFGSDQHHQHHGKAQEELFAEKLRVLYVALTRAKYRNYIAWGKIGGIECAALSWLLYGQEKMTLSDFMQQVKNIDDAAFWQPWQALASTTLIPLPLAPLSDLSPLQPVANKLTAALWRRPALALDKIVTSFSALTHHKECPKDHVQPGEEGTQLILNQQDIAAFPAGARTGLCWHSILERWDFQPGEHLPQLINHHLQAYGFALEWEAPLTHLLTTLSHISFAGQPLYRLSASQRLVEAAFTFRLAPVTYRELAQLLQQAGEGVWARACQTLRFEIACGMMTGFIDLVVEADGRYFVVDYKSNRLGATTAAYHQDALQIAMASHHYYLQYLIYTVAIHRYLRQRIPTYTYATHFGGVVYIFMRGLIPSTGSGIFRDRPNEALIDALDKLLDRDAIC
jgi:exodeoxyribonuclease V beta subunit